MDEFVVYVILLALVGLFTLVRKLVEKATAGEEGRKIDIARAVHERIRKYMGEEAAGPGLPTLGSIFGQTPAPPSTPTAPASAPPAPARGEKSVPRLVPAREPTVPMVVAPRRALADTTAAAIVSLPVRVGPRIRLRRDNLREAVVLAELMGPPVAMRPTYRLF